MANILLAFITGLTTGGLSCLAVQGGLLASSLANRLESDLRQTTAASTSGRKSKTTRAPSQKRSQLAQPVLAFLAAKVVAYTLLGFLLGLVGQVFQLSPLTRAFLQIGIGVFMLGSALRMLNVHPIFRFFAFEPPAFLRRKLRRTAAAGDGASLSTPLFLGFLTVLIPCGVTQAMMAVAIGTADPFQGAALMAAFTLGTSPVFFAVAYFATQLGSRLEKHFKRFVAVVVLVLALVTIDSGLNLAGSPISVSRFVSGLTAQTRLAGAGPALESAVPPGSSSSLAPSPADPASPVVGDTDIITINVENYGYTPDVLHAKAGVPLRLRLITEDVRSCSRAIVIPALNEQMILDATGEAWIEIPAQSAGTRMPYSCSMGMYTGEIVFDL